MGHKYVGLDVHQSSTVAAVHDEQGKSVMESILAGSRSDPGFSERAAGNDPRNLRRRDAGGLVV